MNRIIIATILLALGMTGMISCAKPKDLQYLDFENLRLQKASMAESVVSADIKYFNPNHFKLQLKQADFDVFVNDKFMGHSHLDTLIHIPELDTFYVPVTMNLQLGELMKNALQLLIHPEVTLKVQGQAKVGKAGIYRNFPFTYEGKERIDQLLKDTALSKW